MAYYSKEIIKKIKEIDLLTYLSKYEPNELIHINADNYCTKTHDSLKISNGMWYWFSHGIGGKSALDYLIKVREYSFLDAMSILTNLNLVVINNINFDKKEKEKIDRLILPKKSSSYDTAKKYLINRGIDEEIVQECIDNEYIYEDYPNKNVVFLGYDDNKNPRYASCRATGFKRFMYEASGSDKTFSFRLLSKKENDSVHLFESAIDLLSYATILKEENIKWYEENLISLAGIYTPANDISNSKVPKTIEKFLSKNTNIKRIYIHFDNDLAGRMSANALNILLKNNYEIIDNQVPFGKDINDFLCLKSKKNIKKSIKVL